MANEFIIWGIPKNGDTEVLLVSENAGLVDRDHADRTVTKLATEYGCTEMRVQELKPVGSAQDIIDAFKGAVA